MPKYRFEGFQDLLSLANDIVDGRTLAQATHADKLATSIVDLFGESQPCGASEPIVTTIPDNAPKAVRVPEDWPGVYTPAEARALAVMLLHAADEAES